MTFGKFSSYQCSSYAFPLSAAADEPRAAPGQLQQRSDPGASARQREPAGEEAGKAGGSGGAVPGEANG